jgi:hypothetical protein
LRSSGDSVAPACFECRLIAATHGDTARYGGLQDRAHHPSGSRQACHYICRMMPKLRA